MNTLIKIIKTIVIVSALNGCWQHSTMTMEQPPGKDNPLKRSASPAGLSTGENKLPYEYYGELTDPLVDYLDLKRDQNTLLALLGTCCAYKSSVTQKYSDANATERHYPWQDNLSIMPSTLYIFNTRLRTILGLYINIMNVRIEHNAFCPQDRAIFLRACDRFVGISCFSKSAIPVVYVDILNFDLELRTRYEADSDEVEDIKKLQAKQDNCKDIFTKIANPQNLLSQNEMALYYHFCQFAQPQPQPPAQEAFLKNAFEQLNNSLMAVMNPKLLDLKDAAGLSEEGVLAETWMEIIELDPAPTISMLDIAARSCEYYADDADDDNVAYTYIMKTIKYLEDIVRISKTMGLSPTVTAYNNIANAYYFSASRLQTPLRGLFYANAAKYQKKKIKTMITEQGTFENEYDFMAHIHLQSAENTTDPELRDIRLAKAAKYAKKEIQVLLASRQEAGFCFRRLADIFYKCWKNSRSPHTRIIYATEAVQYYDLSLKIGLYWQWAQEVQQFLKELHTDLSRTKTMEFITRDDPYLAG